VAESWPPENSTSALSLASVRVTMKLLVGFARSGQQSNSLLQC